MQIDFELIAKDSVHYFENAILGHDAKDPRWRCGLGAAIKWCHLINSDTVSYDEFEELVDDIQAKEHYRGSIWGWMIIHILVWGMTKGFPAPPILEPGIIKMAKPYIDSYKKST